MGKQTNIGLTVSIVEGLPATQDQAGFEALTFVKVGQVTNVGPSGATAAEVPSKPLETGITEYFIGFIDFGNMTIDMDFDEDDAGQLLIRDAMDINDTSFGKEFSVKLKYLSGTTRYFVGRFFGAPETAGGADSMVTMSTTYRINKQPVYVAAP